MQKAKFTLSDDYEEFEGFLGDGNKSWNGWASPYFTREQLEKAFYPCHITYIIESDNKGIMESMNQMESDSAAEGYFESESCQFDLDYLFDLLNACAPDGFYFGAHPGNGSDYGFWECDEDYE